ncbi:MAG: hypothetical protein ABR610_13650 [Thermoanaerobaculia bacterium]
MRKPDGKPAGTNEIRLLFDGCALQENWVGTDGSAGTSLNVYDASRKVWHQTWVDRRCGPLVLEGCLGEGKMVLSGTSVKKDGPVENRITCNRQEETSASSGRRRETRGRRGRSLLDGTYVRR